MDKKEEKRKKDAARKKKQRAKEHANGEVTVSVTLAAPHAEKLDWLCENLGGYDKSELIALLVYRKWQEVEKIVLGLGMCEFCENALPSGCGGKFKGHGECWKTRKEREALKV